ncbi:hypothetical protein FJTKL_11963 [Diaporthe vaccinii]|uniref:SWIM-type domain-containing protein n=1 Tax=Diaporthe vaccinii TaxID=105482 RepID=A0ABR4FAP4_9PEZI
MHKTLDPAILAVLPAGCKVIAVKSHGKGSWSTGHKVEIDRDTQRVILFDSCCCYAHNELDLGMMREPRYRFTCEHASKYLESMRPSQPEEDFDDRNAIYAMRDNIINAGLHDHRASLRGS